MGGNDRRQKKKEVLGRGKTGKEMTKKKGEKTLCPLRRTGRKEKEEEAKEEEKRRRGIRKKERMGERIHPGCTEWSAVGGEEKLERRTNTRGEETKKNRRGGGKRREE